MLSNINLQWFTDSFFLLPPSGHRITENKPPKPTTTPCEKTSLFIKLEMYHYRHNKSGELVRQQQAPRADLRHLNTTPGQGINSSASLPEPSCFIVSEFSAAAHIATMTLSSGFAAAQQHSSSVITHALLSDTAVKWTFSLRHELLVCCVCRQYGGH